MDSNGNFSFGLSNISEEAEKLLPRISALQEAGSSLSSDWDSWATKMDITDQSLISFLKTNDYAVKDLNSYTQYIKANSAALNMQTLATKAATIAKKALLNISIAAAFTLATKAITFAIQKINDYTHAAERCKERVNELMATHKSALNTANSNAKTVEGLVGKYETLSKGVNDLGLNVSLTADEYKEYNDIVNQIADMFPTLIGGYTDEGNAILSLKGNVEQLRDAYKEAQLEAHRLLITSGKDSDGNDIINNFNNELFGKESWISKSSSFIDGKAGAKDAIDIITKLTGCLTPDEFRDTYNELYAEYKNIWNSSKIQDALKSSGIDDLTHAEKWGNITSEDLAKIKQSANATAQTYQAAIDTALNEVQILGNAYLLTNEDYSKLDAEAQTAASIIVNSIDENIATGFQSKVDVGAYVSSIVDMLQDDSTLENAAEFKDSLINLLKLDTSDMSVGEIQETINTYINNIANALDEEPIDVKIRLGFSDYLADGKINSQIEYVKDNLQDKFDDMVGELSLEDLEIAVRIDVDPEALKSWDELLQLIEEKKTNDLALPDVPFNITDESTANSIDDFQSKLKSLSSALEKVKDSKLTSNDFIDLQQDFPTLIEETDNLNEALTNLIDEALVEMMNYLESIGAPQEFIDICKKAAEEAKGVSDEIESIVKVKTISDIDKLSSGFDSLDKIMASVQGKEPFDFTLLADDTFKETFSGLGDSYADFIEQITNSPNDISACQSAFDDLVTTWLNSTDILSSVTDETETLTVAMLTNMGITNAAEVVADALAQSYAQLAAEKYYNATASAALEGATADEILQILDEAEATGISKEELAKLELAKIAASEAEIDLENDIDQIYALAEAAGAGIEVLNRFAAAKQGITSGLLDPGSVNYDRFASLDYHSLTAGLNSGNFDFKYEKPKTVNYGGGAKTNKSSGSNKKEKEETKKEFDWMQRALDVLSKKREDYQKVIDDETESYQDQHSALEQLIALDKQFIELNNQAIDTYTKRLEMAKDELLRVFGDEAGNAIIGKVLNGDLTIEGSTDEYTQTEADYIQATIDALSDLESAKDKHRAALEAETEHVRKQYTLRIAEIESYIDKVNAKMTKAQSKLSIKDTTGKEITVSDYKQLIALSKQQVSLYRDQIDALGEQLDTVEPMSAEYYNIQSSIASCQNAIVSAAEAQAEWNEKIKRIPIDRIQRYLELLGYIKQDIQNFIDEQSALGIGTTQAQYQQLIQISNEEITKLLEQQKKLSTLLKDYEYNSDKYNEVAGEIQDIENAISSLVQSQHEWNQAILQIPIDSLNKAKDTLQSVASTMSDVLSDYDTVISAIVSTIDKEIESINDLRDSTTDYYDELIDPLQEQLDLLKDTNKERSIQIALEKAQYELEKARNQKKVAVVRNGEITYEADADAVRNAQESLQDAEYNKLVHDLETQISNLEDARDALLESYDDQIKALEKIKNKWSELVNEIKLAADQAKVTEMFGEGWQSSVLSGNDAEMYEAMKDMYSTMYNQQQSYKDQIDSYERIADMMSQFVEKFQDGSITYEEAMSGIGNLIDAMDNGFSSLDYLNALTDLNGASDLSSLLSSMESSANASVNQFQDYMKIVKANSDALAEYTTSWAELQQLVQQQINELKKLYEKSVNKMSNAETHHTGVVSGYVGNLNQDKALKAVQSLTTEDLAPNEVPSVLTEGELVLNPSQISTLLDNIAGIGNIAMPVYQPPAIDYSSILGTTKESDSGVTINTMNVQLPNVHDGDGFVKAIDGHFRNLMNQGVTKRKR